MEGALSVEPLNRSVVTVGTFDGVHRGHQSLVSCARRCAAAADPVVAYTFDPHPATLFAREPPRSLMPLDRRCEALIAAGADHVVVEPFTKKFASLEAEEWLIKHILGPFQPRAVVIGFNFSFGKGRVGDPDFLRIQGEKYGFRVEVVDPVHLGTRVVSSTEVRLAVSEGDIQLATELMGRPFAVVGSVVSGDGRGKSLGFPTANIEPQHTQLPKSGVYAGWLEVLGSHDQRFAAVANVGTRPTFQGDGQRVEVHAINQDLSLYGSRVAFHVLARLREELTFPGPEALHRQINVDVDRARKVLGVYERT